MALSCLLFWALWLPMMLALVAAEEQAESCSSKRCGNLTISHPFWLADMKTGRSCGVLDFEVDCSNSNTPILRSSGVYGFVILNITYKEGSMRVIDLGEQEILNDSGGCHVSSWNTSDKLSLPFMIDPGNMNLVFYNCTTTTAAAAHGDPALVQMRCGRENNTFVRVGGYYNSSESYEGYYKEGCEATVVPVLGSPGQANASDYEQLISDGFLLTWNLPPRAFAVVGRQTGIGSICSPRRATHRWKQKMGCRQAICHRWTSTLIR